jgi:hypothetical protein
MIFRCACKSYGLIFRAADKPKCFIAFAHNKFSNRISERSPFRKHLPQNKETFMSKSNQTIVPRRIQAGDKVARDAATASEGKVYLGDSAPIFRK